MNLLNFKIFLLYYNSRKYFQKIRQCFNNDYEINFMYYTILTFDEYCLDP